VTQLECDVCIVGGGTGGTAAALALAKTGLRVVLTEETDWIGGQLTSQAVPPDEHPWIETTGCTASYREFRNRVRATYRTVGKLTEQALQKPHLNPGGGWVSHLCYYPVLGHQVLQEMLGEIIHPEFKILYDTTPISANVLDDSVQSVTVQSSISGEQTQITAKYFLDATELGDLLPLTGTEYNLGAESKAQTQEPNALDGEPERTNVQSFTWCAALGYDEHGDHTIDKPSEYDFWASYQPPNWPDKLLSFTMLHVQRGEPVHFPLFSENWFNLFSYRQIVNPELHIDHPEPATIMNWPMNDFERGSIIDVSADTAAMRYISARQLTLSMVYWLQTEHGYKGLRLRPDLTGTKDGLAKSAYIRESRRIQARHTVLEQHVAAYTNPGQIVAPEMPMSVGVGAYRIDLHPSANGSVTIDTSTLPFQIPLGTLIPLRMKNLLPACKNLGVTHITNGCYRLHPIEWNIGEAAGYLAAFAIRRNCLPTDVLENETLFEDFQNVCWKHGIQTDWPRLRPL